MRSPVQAGFRIPFEVGNEAGSRSTNEVSQCCFQEQTASPVTHAILTERTACSTYKESDFVGRSRSRRWCIGRHYDVLIARQSRAPTNRWRLIRKGGFGLRFTLTGRDLFAWGCDLASTGREFALAGD